MDTDTYGLKFPSCVTGIVLPNGMTTISKSGFDDYTHLQTIIIPEGVTTIVSYAFSNCTSLTSVIIPEGVTTIGNYAFYQCTSLATINYTGTEEQWKAISTGSYWYYGTSFNVIYNYKPE